MIYMEMEKKIEQEIGVRTAAIEKIIKSYLPKEELQRSGRRQAASPIADAGDLSALWR